MSTAYQNGYQIMQVWDKATADSGAAYTVQEAAAFIANGSNVAQISFFGATPVSQQSGSVVTALANYGLVTSPTFPVGSLTGLVIAKETSYSNSSNPFGFTNVSGINFAIAVNEAWVVDVVIHAATSANGFKLKWTGPAGTTFNWVTLGNANATTQFQFDPVVVLGNISGTTWCVGTAGMCHLRLYILADGTHSGTVQLAAENLVNSQTVTFNAVTMIAVRQE